ERLAAAGRHQHQRVAPADDVADDLLLPAAEGVEAEHPVQHGRGSPRPVWHPGDTRTLSRDGGETFWRSGGGAGVGWIAGVARVKGGGHAAILRAGADSRLCSAGETVLSRSPPGRRSAP